MVTFNIFYKLNREKTEKDICHILIKYKTSTWFCCIIEGAPQYNYWEGGSNLKDRNILLIFSSHQPPHGVSYKPTCLHFYNKNI